MTDTLTIALAQMNAHVGDIAANRAAISRAMAEARAAGADLLATPELSISGYPPEDLVLRPTFVRKCMAAVEELARETGADLTVLVGTPWTEQGRTTNAVAILTGGQIAGLRHKVELPNEGVFDEVRVFDPGEMPGPIGIEGVRIGLPICQDMWVPDVIECIEESGGEIILVINGSPFEVGKSEERLQHAVSRVVESGLPLIYLNTVGGQDELVFDGASFVVDTDRTLKWLAPEFETGLYVTRWTREAGGAWRCAQGERHEPLDPLASTYRAMVLGLRDYVNKNGFPGVLLGLSGGIDSALSAAVAVDALGADRVACVMMPSPYTSRESLEDAQAVADLLAVRYETIAIGAAMDAFGDMLAPLFADSDAGIAEENIQSRSRGMILMALSNKFGQMVLSTGNKSEMSVGYATLYGDMCGGYSVLKDAYKTTVFELSRWRNRTRPAGGLGPDGPVMPDRVITKPPSAELKPDQTDQDSLPPYEILDGILRCLIEEELGAGEIEARGYDRPTINRVWRLLDRAEYKRRQAPPGVKLTCKSFGRDRRYPITNAYTSLI